MRIQLSTSLLIVALLAALPASSESFLDKYLHNIKIDQQTAQRPESDAQWTFQVLEEPHTLGQSFTTGPDVTEIYQIAIQTPNWNEYWGEGTSLVMTLYDSPQKTTRLAEFEMKYEWRSWDDMIVVFPIKAQAQGNHTYYFELSVRGGNGKIGSIMTAPADYAKGQAYIDGKPQSSDLIFEDYVYTPWDRDKTYQEQFSKIRLDYAGLERVKAAAEKKDWETAAKELVAYFENRADLVTPPQERHIKANLDPNFDRSYPDLVADMKIMDADDKEVSLGPRWNHLRWWPTRGGIGLSRSGIRKDLSAGYYQTGDEKFAVAWNEMLKSVFIDLPSPLKSGEIPPGAMDVTPRARGGIGGGAMWSALSIGARMGHGFAYYSTFVDSPNFTWDVRAAFIMNMIDMAEVLAVQKGGGNWATQMNDGLFEFGRTYPEFVRSKEFFEVGYKGMLANMRDTLSPDGPIGESAGYQGLVHGRYVSIVGDARKLGLDMPEDIRKNIELAAQFHMYTTQPDGHMPAFGDGNPDATMKDLLKGGYEQFGRKDMLYVATDGKEGKRPDHTSFEFPYSKYYVMRSDWTPDALYACFKNGHYTSHGHKDSLGFVMYALGNPIFTDPGVYIYGTPDAIRQSSTLSHSTITVDGKNLQNDGSPNQFFIGESVDYLNMVGPGYEELSESICPVRRVVYMKPDYWVFSDVVRGEGEHQVDSRFHYANNNAKLLGDGTAVTTYTTGGNLAAIPVDPKQVSVALDQGDTTWGRETLNPAYILKQSAKNSLPFKIDNVMYPFRGASPGAKVTRLAVTEGAGAEVSGIRIDTDKGIDYAIFTDAPGRRVAFADAGLQAAAQSAVVRSDRSGKVKSFSWIWGKGLVNSKLLAASGQLIPALDVVYNGNTVRVTIRQEDPSLKIASMGATTLVLNGSKPKPIKTTNGYFKPFASKSTEYILTDDELPGFSILQPLVGGNAGGEDQIGFYYHSCHTAPGRPSAVRYKPVLPKPGVYEVSVFVPHTSQYIPTSQAHYILKCKSEGKCTLSGSSCVKSTDTGKVSSGIIELRIDQASAQGKWVSLGRFELDPGAAYLDVQADSEERGPLLLTDAVKWQFIEPGVK